MCDFFGIFGFVISIFMVICDLWVLFGVYCVVLVIILIWQVDVNMVLNIIIGWIGYGILYYRDISFDGHGIEYYVLGWIWDWILYS